MNVANDGHLSLFVCDLNPEHRDVMSIPDADHFTIEAQIAASYANAAGYKVTYFREGCGGPYAMKNVGGRYLAQRRLKKNGWPVAIPRNSPRLASGGNK